jgi:hypothetical protein
MLPLSSTVNLRHSFDYPNYDFNIILANNIPKNQSTIYATDSVDEYLRETNTTASNFLIDLDNVTIWADDQNFADIFSVYLGGVLQNIDKDNVNFFKQNYILDLKLKSLTKTRFANNTADLNNIIHAIDSIDVSSTTLNLDYNKLPFLFLLANWLLDKRGHDVLMNHVKFYCWNLLFGEFEIFIRDACIDYYSRHQIIPNELENLITDTNIRRQLKFTDNIDQSISNFKSIFSEQEAKSMVHRYFKATRDESYIESYDEPIELIYAGEYEKLLLRDLEGPFKIVYATDELWDHHVTTLLSHVYRCYRINNIKDLERFRVKI